MCAVTVAKIVITAAGQGDIGQRALLLYSVHNGPFLRGSESDIMHHVSSRLSYLPVHFHQHIPVQNDHDLDPVLLNKVKFCHFFLFNSEKST